MIDNVHVNFHLHSKILCAGFLYRMLVEFDVHVREAHHALLACRCADVVVVVDDDSCCFLRAMNEKTVVVGRDENARSLTRCNLYITCEHHRHTHVRCFAGWFLRHFSKYRKRACSTVDDATHATITTCSIGAIAIVSIRMFATLHCDGDCYCHWTRLANRYAQKNTVCCYTKNNALHCDRIESGFGEAISVYITENDGPIIQLRFLINE